MIKNIVWDIGNVIIELHITSYIDSLDYDFDTKEFLKEKVFRGDEWQRGMDIGTKTLAQAEEALCKRYPEKTQEITELLQTGFEPLFPVRKDVIGYISELRQSGYKEYILSNLSQEIHDCIRVQYPNFDNLFDGLIVSYKEGVIKPASEIEPTSNLYKRLLEKYQLKPEETVFLDDTPINIEMAKKLGIHGIIYKDLEQGKEELNKIITEYTEFIL